MSDKMSKTVSPDQADIWDDTLLIKAYDDSIKLAREHLAKRISMSTNTEPKENDTKSNSSTKPTEDSNKPLVFKVGDYARATYEDGVDYEAKILHIEPSAGTCLLKYIGYDNEQEVNLADIVPSWGRKYRRLQFETAKKSECPVEDLVATKGKKSKSHASTSRGDCFGLPAPPPPPMPPMLTQGQSKEESEHLSAMLMSWYMSGYYTGVYQGIQMSKSKSKTKKNF